MRRSGFLACVSAGVLIAAQMSGATAGLAADGGQQFGKDCAMCHREAAPAFVEHSVRQQDGRLLTAKTGEEMKAFLQDHFGNRSEQQIDAIVEFMQGL